MSYLDLNWVNCQCSKAFKVHTWWLLTCKDTICIAFKLILFAIDLSLLVNSIKLLKFTLFLNVHTSFKDFFFSPMRLHNDLITRFPTWKWPHARSVLEPLPGLSPPHLGQNTHHPIPSGTINRSINQDCKKDHIFRYRQRQGKKKHFAFFSKFLLTRKLQTLHWRAELKASYTISVINASLKFLNWNC